MRDQLGERGRREREGEIVDSEMAFFHFSWAAREGLPPACIRPVNRLGLASHYCQS